MACDHFIDGNSIIHRLDPRVRVVIGSAFSFVIAAGQSGTVLVLGLLLALFLAGLARLPIYATMRRLTEINIFMSIIIVVLPFSTPGSPLFSLGPFTYSREGFLQAILIAGKGNAVVLLMTVFLATMDTIKLGHALSCLKIPAKLVHLLLFTVRYIDVLDHEYRRLVTAMKTRCFKPGMNMHTYRSLAYLVAMLLVKSYDRSHRILAAMKCRGFQGKFYLLQDFTLSRNDAVFCILSAITFVAIIWLGWF